MVLWKYDSLSRYLPPPNPVNIPRYLWATPEASAGNGEGKTGVGGGHKTRLHVRVVSARGSAHTHAHLITERRPQTAVNNVYTAQSTGYGAEAQTGSARGEHGHPR